MAREIDFGAVFRALRGSDPGDVVDGIAMAAGELGGSDVVVYLVDFDQQVLEPLPDRSIHVDLPKTEDVATTIAGSAFLYSKVRTASGSDGTRVWAPIIEGSDTTGVVALTVTETDESVLEACAELGVLGGYLIAAHARVTDLYNLHRRRQSMSLAASMQWDLLPPLTLSSRGVDVAGMLEPAYEVGGDCFDYALNGRRLEVAMMDSMGHGLHSALIAGLAMSSYRHDRREARTLERIHANLDAVVAAEGSESFVTGQIGHLDLATGTFTWINAGHPPPMLVRHGRMAQLIEGAVAAPWGVGFGDITATTTALEPGDGILLYTDGVSEARGARKEAFGIERLADLVDEYASDQLEVALLIRRIVRAVVEHHDGQLSDDAALLMFKWRGTHPMRVDQAGV